MAAAAARVVLLAGPSALAFASGGYFEGARLVAAIAAWSLLAVLALALPRPLPGGVAAAWAIGGLAALTGWALLSRSWAPLGGPAGADAQRDALYLGALAATAVAWRPRPWARAVEPALAAGTLLVVGYGLAGRVLPGVVHLAQPVSAGGRLAEPLTYWNATGALAAIGFVLCARLAGDRDRPPPLRALAAGAAVPLAAGLYLTFSRGALAAVGAGLLALLLADRSWPQLRAGALCVEAGVVAAALVSKLDGVASLHGSVQHREAQGAVALVVLLALVLVVVAFHAHACHAEREERLRLGALPLPRAPLLLATLALVALPYVLAVGDERGRPAFGATQQRLSSLGSNRYAYWRVAARTFERHPLKGTGSASFAVEWLRERPFPEAVRDAHSLYLETLAELGIVGFAALAALLGGVAAAARRAALPGASAALVVWAVHAGVDWDWEMPALTLVAVALAGLLLGQARPARRPPG